MACSRNDDLWRWLDGTLPAAQIEGMETHLKHCPACCTTHSRYTELRLQLQHHKGDLRGQAYRLAQILAESGPPQPKPPWWRRTIAVPVPLAAAALVVLGLLLWLNWTRPAPAAGTLPDRTLHSSGSFFAQYDSGGKPELFVIPAGSPEDRQP